MRGRGVRLVVLCEDDEHLRFVHHVFRKLDRGYRKLRTQVCPGGRGAAEKWVRNRYAEEIRSHRRKAASQADIGLVVVIDADRQTVDYRHKQLSSGLDEAGLDERGPAERIAIWVPKRHIETWVADLLGRAVNEEDDYKSLMAEADYHRATAAFVERYRHTDSRPADLLPSMSRAFDETARLPT